MKEKTTFAFRMPVELLDQIEDIEHEAGAEAVLSAIKAAMKYYIDGSEPYGLPLAARVLYRQMRQTGDIDKQRYDAICARNKANGQKHIGNSMPNAEPEQIARPRMGEFDL